MKIEKYSQGWQKLYYWICISNVNFIKNDFQYFKKRDNSPNPVVIAVDEDGKIKAGFIDPLSVEGGPVELPRDDCGISRVDDVCERFDGPKLP